MFILGYVIDYLAGPIQISITNPFDFLRNSTISTYPFTSFSIALKSTFIIISLLMSLSMIPKKQLAKSVFLVFLTAFFELYSIQEIATGNRLITLPWSLSFAFSGILLLIPALIYLFLGLGKLIHHSISDKPHNGVLDDDSEEPDI